MCTKGFCDRFSKYSLILCGLFLISYGQIVDEMCREARVVGLPYTEIDLDWSIPEPPVLVSEGVWLSQSKNFTGPKSRGIKMTVGSHSFAMRISLEDDYGPYIRVGRKTCHMLDTDDQENCKLQSFYGGLLPRERYNKTADESIQRLDLEQNTTVALRENSGASSVTFFGSQLRSMGELGDVSIPDFDYWVENATNNDTQQRLTLGEYQRRAFISLNSTSPFIERLLGHGYIHSRVWSFFAGWRGADADTQVDGLLVLGGYDASKFDLSFNFAHFPISEDPDCPLKVKISDFRLFGKTVPIHREQPTELNWENSEFRNTYSEPDNIISEPLEACIDPELDGIMMPGMYRFYDELYRTFPLGNFIPEGPSNHTPAFFEISKSGLESDLRRLDPSITKFDTAINITMDRIRFPIPIHQLCLPKQNLTATGYRSDGDSLIVAFSYPPPRYGNKIRLGMQFLSGTYLTVDFEGGSFKLDPIHEKISPKDPPRLVPYVRGPCEKMVLPKSFKERKGIIGGILGGVLVIVIFAGYWFWDARCWAPKLPKPPEPMGIEIDGKDKLHPELEGLSRLEAFGVPIHQKGDSDVPRARALCCNCGGSIHELDANDSSSASADIALDSTIQSQRTTQI